jgi:hypothetical protein
MSIKYSDWPSGGPQKWISEWQNLIGDCKKWCSSLNEQWISDFNLVWGEVPRAKFLCSQMRMDQKKGQAQEWSIYNAGQELLDAWNDRIIRNGMKQGGKSTMTKASFATEPLFDGKEVEDKEDSKGNSSKSKDKRKRKFSPETTDKENKKKPCWICDGPHRPKTCFLALEVESKKLPISEENREVFARRMKDSIFAKRIQAIRENLKKQEDLFSQ